MAIRGWNEKARHAPRAVLALFPVLVGLSAASAQAQVVQDCLPDQYLDRTAPNADRQLTWDFSITTDPERCLQVRTGQTVVWNGDLDTHPLAGQGGDTPNSISLHQNGSVTFNAAGTFGFVCLSHSSMKGAIRVVQPAAVPALSSWLAVALTVLLLASGLVLIPPALTSRQRAAAEAFSVWSPKAASSSAMRPRTRAASVAMMLP